MRLLCTFGKIKSLFSPFGGSLKRDCSPLLLYHRISFCLFAKKRFLAFVYPRVVILTTLLRSLIRYRNGIFGQTLIPLQTSLQPSSKCIFKQTQVMKVGLFWVLENTILENMTIAHFLTDFCSKERHQFHQLP